MSATFTLLVKMGALVIYSLIITPVRVQQGGRDETVPSRLTNVSSSPLVKMELPVHPSSIITPVIV